MSIVAHEFMIKLNRRQNYVQLPYDIFVDLVNFSNHFVAGWKIFFFRNHSSTIKKRERKYCLNSMILIGVIFTLCKKMVLILFSCRFYAQCMLFLCHKTSHLVIIHCQSSKLSKLFKQTYNQTQSLLLSISLCLFFQIIFSDKFFSMRAFYAIKLKKIQSIFVHMYCVGWLPWRR